MQLSNLFYYVPTKIVFSRNKKVNNYLFLLAIDKHRKAYEIKVKPKKLEIHLLGVLK